MVSELKDSEVILSVLEQLNDEHKQQVQAGYNDLLTVLNDLVAKHGPLSIMSFAYLGAQLSELPTIEPFHFPDNLPIERLNLVNN